MGVLKAQAQLQNFFKVIKKPIKKTAPVMAWTSSWVLPLVFEKRGELYRAQFISKDITPVPK
jgi:hypothetical protein